MLKSTVILTASSLLLFYFTAIVQGFNPQPEPPGTEEVQPQETSMPPPGRENLEATPESLTETDAGKIQITPRMSQPYTVTQPVKLQGGKAGDRPPKTLIETDPDKIKINPQMSETVTDTMPFKLQGSEDIKSQDEYLSPGEPKMEDSGKRSSPGMKSRKRYNRQMER